MNHRRQLKVLAILLGIYALCAFLTYTFFINQLTDSVGTPMPKTDLPAEVFGLANAGIVFVVYGLLGEGGYWFARKLGLPGLFREGGSWRGVVLHSAGDRPGVRRDSHRGRRAICPD